MINWSCIIQGRHRLSINCSVAASSSLTGECKCAAGAGAAGPLLAAPPCPKTSAALPPLHLWVIFISQPCIHHCPMAFWDPVRIVITTNTALRSIYSVFSICRHKRMVLAEKEAEGLCGLLSALDGLGQVISNLLQCSHPHNGDNSSHATAALARLSLESGKGLRGGWGCAACPNKCQVLWAYFRYLNKYICLLKAEQEHLLLHGSSISDTWSENSKETLGGLQNDVLKFLSAFQ